MIFWSFVIATVTLGIICHFQSKKGNKVAGHLRDILCAIFIYIMMMFTSFVGLGFIFLAVVTIPKSIINISQGKISKAIEELLIVPFALGGGIYYLKGTFKFIKKDIFGIKKPSPYGIPDHALIEEEDGADTLKVSLALLLVYLIPIILAIYHYLHPSLEYLSRHC